VDDPEIRVSDIYATGQPVGERAPEAQWKAVMSWTTPPGASAHVGNIFDADPICINRTVPVSSQSEKSGSQ
jgi:hypothetical protein